MQLGENRASARRRKRRFWLAVEIICAAVFIALAALIANKAWRASRIRDEEAAADSLMNQISGTISSVETASPSAFPGSAADSSAPPPINDSFEDLLKQNPDTVGLVEFAEDQTMYVCQADDNLYYLNHRFDKSEDAAGMVFMDCRCSIWPASDNIILYGHDMRDGSRFGELKRYQRREYLAEHPKIRFASLYELHDYAPFAVILTSVGDDPASYFHYAKINFESQEDFSAYIAEARERSLYAIDCDVNFGDKLLTLVTCSHDLDDGRLIILCRQIAE